MTAQIMHEVLRLIEADVKSRPSAAEFEMAYQARVAIDRIKFAIRHTEQFAPHTDQMREAGLQLLNALERLESADRNFQNRFGLLLTFRTFPRVTRSTELLILASKMGPKSDRLADIGRA